MDYKTVRVESGRGGFGGPLTITPTDERPTVACITGGGIHPVAEKIGELTGAEVVDAFRTGVKFDKMACVVIDCGGAARCGVYPQKKVPTINIMPCGPSGFLSRYMKPDIYVSGVKPENVTLVEE